MILESMKLTDLRIILISLATVSFFYVLLNLLSQSASKNYALLVQDFSYIILSSTKIYRDIVR